MKNIRVKMENNNDVLTMTLFAEKKNEPNPYYVSSIVYGNSDPEKLYEDSFLTLKNYIETH